MPINKTAERRRTVYYANPFILPPECDALCYFRPCYHKYENKGAFAVGTGYTKYSDDFMPVCATRQAHGCPGYRGSVDDEADMAAAVRQVAAISASCRDRRLTASDRSDRSYADRLLTVLARHPRLQKSQVDGDSYVAQPDMNI